MPRRKHRWSGPDCRCISLGKGRSPGLGPKATTCARFAWQLNSAGRQCPLAVACADWLDGAVLKSQVGLLVGGLGFTIGALAFPALRWKRRRRGQIMTDLHDVRYERIGESFAAVLAVQKPACHWRSLGWARTVGQRLEDGVCNSLPTAVGATNSSCEILASVWRIGNCQN